MNFNSFYWHDAIIKEIRIVRSNPSINDTIVFDLVWPEEDSIVNFVFEEVYWASLNLNFGISSDETILHAYEIKENDQDLSNLYLKWKGLINDVKLKVYKFNLNSTGSEIKIIAKTFKELK